MATKTKRLEIRAEEGFINELNRLAEASGTTRAEVIDRAIGLYATALHEVEQGKTLKFVFPDSKRETAAAAVAQSGGAWRDVTAPTVETVAFGTAVNTVETIR